MNRIVLIGNGFDKAHGLHTGYEDFIYWYWKKRIQSLYKERSNVSIDPLCKLTIQGNTWDIFVWQNNLYLKNTEGKEIYNYLKSDKAHYSFEYSPFFERIHKRIETKKWVDIENEYYELLTKYSLEVDDEIKVIDLNEQLLFLQNKLVEYLTEVNKIEVKPIKSIESAICNPFKLSDVSIGGLHALKEHIEGGLALSEEQWRIKLLNYGFDSCMDVGYFQDFENRCSDIIDYKKKYEDITLFKKRYEDCLEKDLYINIFNNSDVFRCPESILFPNNTMLLNFNYTKTAQLYCRSKEVFTLSSIIQIHGKISQPESVIFGYGDEMDEKYKELVKKNDNNCLSNIKSIKYLESDNYRKVLSFIESEPYQILIMGHSCGNSDRTLLNTLFEHDNCVSIKPYYYINDEGKDNYIDIVQNISRNFNDMKLMRDRVVNKLYCEPLTKKDSQESDQ